MIYNTSCDNSQSNLQNSISNNISESETEKAPIVDAEGKFFRDVKIDMTQEQIVDIFGNPHDESYEQGLYEGTHHYSYIYYVSSVPELDPYISYTYNNEYGPYKYCYKFSFSETSLELETWTMYVKDYDVPSDVLDYIKNTAVPELIDDYPNLKFDSESFRNYSTYYEFYAPYDGDAHIEIYSSDCIINDYDKCISIFGYLNHSNSGGSGNYDKSDKYYSNNDSDNDGYINDDEFQNAVGDWMDDHGY